MTAREILDETDCNGYAQGEVFGEFYYEDEDILKALKEFAEQKCKELLEIVAEKAYAQVEYDCAIIGKDSILNAVNLKEFIK